MTAPTRTTRSIVTGVAMTLAAVAAITTGVMFASGLGFSDAAGQPLGVSSVVVTPAPVSSTPPVPTATPTPGDDDDSPEVVTGPPPVTVELDDHGGRNGGDDSSGSNSSGSDNSGHGSSDD